MLPLTEQDYFQGRRDYVENLLAYLAVVADHEQAHGNARSRSLTKHLHALVSETLRSTSATIATLERTAH